MWAISTHLADLGGYKAVHITAKNILDYGVSKRLPRIREVNCCCWATNNHPQMAFSIRITSGAAADAATAIGGKSSYVGQTDEQPGWGKSRHPAHGMHWRGQCRWANRTRAERAGNKNQNEKVTIADLAKNKHHRNAPSAIPVRASSRLARARLWGPSSWDY